MWEIFLSMLVTTTHTNKVQKKHGGPKAKLWKKKNIWYLNVSKIGIQWIQCSTVWVQFSGHVLCIFNHLCAPIRPRYYITALWHPFFHWVGGRWHHVIIVQSFLVKAIASNGKSQDEWWQLARFRKASWRAITRVDTNNLLATAFTCLHWIWFFFNHKWGFKDSMKKMNFIEVLGDFWAPWHF